MNKKIQIARVAVLSILLSAFNMTGCGQSSNSGAPGPDSSQLNHQNFDLSGYHYINPGQFDPGSALVRPPQPNTSSELADLQLVVNAQANRSAQDCDHALVEVNEGLNTFFGPPYGPLSNQEVAYYQSFIAKVSHDAEKIEAIEKDIFKRVRPFAVDPVSIHLCHGMQKPTSYSYPSGHSIQAHIMAFVLSKIDPSRRQVFWARADQIAQDRVKAGVHYVSDIDAGEKIAADLFQVFQRNSAFNADLAALQAPRTVSF